MADHQDWDTVVVRKKHKKPRSAAAQNEMRRAGAEVESVRKYNAGTNKHTKTTLNTRKLDEEMEETKHATVSLSLSRAIQQGRQAKGMTQKQLAQKINEKATVVAQYEQGKAIPNNAIIRKMERALGTKLPRAPKKPRVPE